MSASPAPALSATAFQLAATLEAYEQDVAAMVRAPRDPDAYHRVSQHLDQMRIYAGSLPPVSVAWVAVMIRHFELTHGMWRMHQDGDEADLKQLHGYLRDAVTRLAGECVQLIPAA